jgi:hypothetical protein
VVLQWFPQPPPAARCCNCGRGALPRGLRRARTRREPWALAGRRDKVNSQSPPWFLAGAERHRPAPPLITASRAPACSPATGRSNACRISSATRVRAVRRCRVNHARLASLSISSLERWLGDADALFLRRDRAEPLVVLPRATWGRFIKEGARMADDTTQTPETKSPVSALNLTWTLLSSSAAVSWRAPRSPTRWPRCKGRSRKRKDHLKSETPGARMRFMANVRPILLLWM